MSRLIKMQFVTIQDDRPADFGGVFHDYFDANGIDRAEAIVESEPIAAHAILRSTYKGACTSGYGVEWSIWNGDDWLTSQAMDDALRV